jgi:hypothetical protein
MVTIAVLLDFQFDCAVMFWSEPLEKCPVAVNCCVPLTAIEGLIGVMSIPVSVPPEELSPHRKRTRLKESEEHWQECVAVSATSRDPPAAQAGADFS